MSVLLIVVIAVAVIVIGFLAFVATRSADLRIERKSRIGAPPSAVFPHVNDFHEWDAWSPWAKLDPAMKTTFEGPESGAGARYSWVGNNKVGEGRMTILDSRPSDLVRIKLEFLKPFPVTNTAELTFVPDSDGTIVTWTMTGTKNFIVKAFGVFMNMDELVGRDFEKGLADLKAVSEAAAAR